MFRLINEPNYQEPHKADIRKLMMRIVAKNYFFNWKNIIYWTPQAGKKNIKQNFDLLKYTKNENTPF